MMAQTFMQSKKGSPAGSSRIYPSSLGPLSGCSVKRLKRGGRVETEEESMEVTQGRDDGAGPRVVFPLTDRE